MAFIPRFLFLSLLALSILHVKCDDEDLVRGINQYRTSLNLTALTTNLGAECLADQVAERFRTQPCTNTNVTLPRPSDYPDILTRCNLNAATINDSQILPICVPDNEPDLVLLNRTLTQYMSYLNGTQFSGIGVGSEDDWTVLVLTTSTTNGSSPPGSTTPPPPGYFDDDLVRGINQYRTSLNLTALTTNLGAECLADEVAERFRTQPCTNTNVTLPRPSDYPDILTRCNLNAATINDSQILPICVPDNEPDLVLLNRTLTQYMSYLNGTQFSGIGVGSEDDWTVLVLTTSTTNGSSPPGSTTPPPPGSGSTTPPPPGSGSTTPGSGSRSPPPPAGNNSSPGSGGSSPAPGSGSSNPSNGVSGLVAISPITVILIGLFVLV